MVKGSMPGVRRGGRKPGTPKTGGRQKGTPNKLTADVKAMILGALNEAGGQAYLLKRAENNPVAFLTLLGKVLPMTVAGDPNDPLTVVRVELVSAGGNGEG